MSHAIAIKGPIIEKHKKKLIRPRFWCVWIIPQAFMFLLKTFCKMKVKEMKRFEMEWVIKTNFNDIGIYLPSNLPTLRTFRNWCYNLQKTW